MTAKMKTLCLRSPSTDILLKTETVHYKIACLIVENGKNMSYT